MPPFDLEDNEPRPLTTARVILISAIVAFIVGCLPALGTALVVANDFENESAQRSYDNCVTLREGRQAGNERQRQNKISLKADVAIYELVLSTTPTVAPPKGPENIQGVTQEQLDKYRQTFVDAIKTKKNKILPLTKPVPLPPCEADFDPPRPNPTPTP